MKIVPSEERIDEIKKFLRDKFSIETDDISIYDKAFTHSTCGTPNNQRLAFLGDRVFDIIVAEHIMKKHPNHEKGMLDEERKEIHNKAAQTRMARENGLVVPMVFGKTYENTTRSEIEFNEAIMAEVLEALLGAVYVDQGLDKAREVAMRLLSRPHFLAAAPRLQ